MTQQSDEDVRISGEKELALGAEEQPSSTKDDLPAEKDANVGLDVRKFTLGSATLGWCIFLMFACALLASAFPENSLIESAFEAFKLIVTTILGYIFGSNSSSKNES